MIGTWRSKCHGQIESILFDEYIFMWQKLAFTLFLYSFYMETRLGEIVFGFFECPIYSFAHSILLYRYLKFFPFSFKKRPQHVFKMIWKLIYFLRKFNQTSSNNHYDYCTLEYHWVYVRAEHISFGILSILRISWFSWLYAHTYLHQYLQNKLHKYLHTHLHTHLHTELHDNLIKHLHTYLYI